MRPGWFRLLLNLYPPYWGTGIVVKRISPDFKEIVVQMRLRCYNRNYVNTHFGGSLYAMTDPFFMLMLLQILGKEYVVWDKAAQIDFLKPGRGRLCARFVIDDSQIEAIVRHAAGGEKFMPQFTVEIVDETRQAVARVIKTLYVRKKTRNPRPAS